MGAAGVSTPCRSSDRITATNLVGDLENSCVIEGSVETPVAPKGNRCQFMSPVCEIGVTLGNSAPPGTACPAI